jgi:heat-inducible transcriptional repressor
MNMGTMLDNRKQTILSAVIEDFIYSAEPVGSKRLVEKYGWSISSATVRHELALLEEMGYLSQPHTSAGRVPTDMGYRFYVDALAVREAPTTELVHIEGFYGRLTHEIGELMRETSNYLARVTSTMAIVYAPDIRREKIKHIDLIGSGAKSLIIVVIMSNGSISKQALAFGTDIADEALVKLEARLNAALTGASVDEAWRKPIELNGLSAEEAELLEGIAGSVLDSLSGNNSDRVFYDGATYLLDYPELTDLGEMRRVMALIGQNCALLEWLQTACNTGGLTVSIGAENELELSGYTVIASGYEVGGQSVGALGVLGPTRMDYRRAMSAVKQIADELGKALGQLER